MEFRPCFVPSSQTLTCCQVIQEAVGYFCRINLADACLVGVEDDIAIVGRDVRMGVGVLWATATGVGVAKRQTTPRDETSDIQHSVSEVIHDKKLTIR
jgi:hypothetical protein